MTHDEIVALQARVGAEPDGFWGPRSIRAVKRHLRSMMPYPHPFPIQSQVSGFYGPHGVKDGYTPPQAEVDVPFEIYYEDRLVKQVRPHEKCAISLKRVFDRILVMFPTPASRRASGISTYDGLYNPRAMRGGTSWSMHSWAIAIDFDAENNGLNDFWPLKAKMPIEIMECFACEGWMAAGGFWSRDAMHFQATSPD